MSCKQNDNYSRKITESDFVTLNVSELEGITYSELNKLFDLPDSSDIDLSDDEEIIQQGNGELTIVNTEETLNAQNEVDRCRPRPNFEQVPANNNVELADINLENLPPNQLVSNAQNPHPNHDNNILRGRNEVTANRPGCSNDTQTVDHVQNKIQTARSSIWYSGKENSLYGNEPVFKGRWNSNIKGGMPLDYFLEMFPNDLMKMIVFETINYAVYKGKDSFCLTVPELKVFLGINLAMSYLRYSRTNLYWSSAHGTRIPLIADAMSYNRFREIKRYLHFVDISSIPNETNDRLIRIRPILDAFLNSFKSSCDPEENLSLDEMMVPFKGRHSLKQYVRNKPHPWGFKIWTVSGVSGYVYNFEIYQGREARVRTQEASNSASQPEYGVIGDTVLQLSERFKGYNHKLYFDNLFTTIPVLVKLSNWDIYAVGTIRINRLQGANEKLLPLAKLKEKRGSSSCATSGDNVTITRWYDNGPVHVASTFAGIEPVGEAKRWSRKEGRYVIIPRPYAISIYNTHMGGVDLTDSLIGLYRNRQRQKRWYFRIFYHLLDVLVANCWILWRMEHGKSLDLFEFKSSIASSLIYSGTADSARKRGRPGATPPAVKRRVIKKAPVELRKDGGPHYPKKTENKYAAKCHLFGCKKKTRYLCHRCDEPLCPECFQEFHNRA